jgi:hypothetical protein
MIRVSLYLAVGLFIEVRICENFRIRRNRCICFQFSVMFKKGFVLYVTRNHPIFMKLENSLHIRKGPTLHPIRNHVTTSHIHTQNFFMIHFNIILQSSLHYLITVLIVEKLINIQGGIISFVSSSFTPSLPFIYPLYIFISFSPFSIKAVN